MTPAPLCVVEHANVACAIEVPIYVFGLAERPMAKAIPPSVRRITKVAGRAGMFEIPSPFIAAAGPLAGVARRGDKNAKRRYGC